MTSAMTTVVDQPLTAQQVQANINLIQVVMRNTMQSGVHYGKIPGCGEKPALLKPGAEKIMATFRIANEMIVEDLGGADCFRYRVTSRAMSASGQFLGSGVGECSTDEGKYRWRGVVSDDEWNATPEDRRRIKYKSSSTVRQVRTDPADVANTVLKMAKKRALVDMTLTVTAASDIFTQDIDDDDTPPGDSKPPIREPQRKAAPATQSAPSGNVISEPQRKRFYAKCKTANLSDDEVQGYMLEKYGIDSTSNIERGIMYDELCAWADAQAA